MTSYGLAGVEVPTLPEVFKRKNGGAEGSIQHTTWACPPAGSFLKQKASKQNSWAGACFPPGCPPLLKQACCCFHSSGRGNRAPYRGGHRPTTGAKPNPASTLPSQVPGPSSTIWWKFGGAGQRCTAHPHVLGIPAQPQGPLGSLVLGTGLRVARRVKEGVLHTQEVHQRGLKES